MLIFQIANKHLNRAVYAKGGDGGAGAQAKAQQQAIDLQRDQWNTVMNNLKPYAEVDYFKSHNMSTFFPVIPVIFSVTEQNQKLHIPLLLSQYGYSTYRGS